MNEEQIEKLYKELQYLEYDIECTIKAMDENIDYLTRKEYQDDIAYDRRKIEEIKNKIKVLEESNVKVKQLKKL